MGEDYEVLTEKLLTGQFSATRLIFPILAASIYQFCLFEPINSNMVYQFTASLQAPNSKRVHGTAFTQVVKDIASTYIKR